MQANRALCASRLNDRENDPGPLAAALVTSHVKELYLQSGHPGGQHPLLRTGAALAATVASSTIASAYSLRMALASFHIHSRQPFDEAAQLIGSEAAFSRPV